MEKDKINTLLGGILDSITNAELTDDEAINFVPLLISNLAANFVGHGISDEELERRVEAFLKINNSMVLQIVKTCPKIPHEQSNKTLN